MIRLKALRLEKGCNQADVAEYLGITQQAYANYEREARQADYETLNKLSLFFNTSIDYILGHDRNKHISDVENYLISNFRLLSPKGQEYILSTMDAALVLYTKENEGLRLVAQETISAPPVTEDEIEHT